MGSFWGREGSLVPLSFGISMLNLSSKLKKVNVHICEFAVRILFSAVEWASNIPGMLSTDNIEDLYFKLEKKLIYIKLCFQFIVLLNLSPSAISRR